MTEFIPTLQTYEKPIDVSNEVNFIWSIANRLRGAYKSDKYKDVIIPMTIMRRFECALAGTKQKVFEAYEASHATPPKILKKIAGYSFYNHSKFTLKAIIDSGSGDLAANLRAYIEGFSENVRDIFNCLEFDAQITKLNDSSRLATVLQAFSELDLDPKVIDNIKMGYIFEELIRKFSENAEAGDHYTGRDIIRLMVDLLVSEGCDDLSDAGKVVTILDQACGTGGMLSTSYDALHRFNPSMNIQLFGQEINPESYAICLAEMMIKGQAEENIRLADTFKTDCFAGTKMRFVLENPPFGTPWGGKEAADGAENAVKKEFEKGQASRWGAGLPSTGDAQLLFVQSAINKLDPEQGRAVIVENGSPLFTGSTASGESQIRRWLLEKDYLEAIIALPMDMFYNTGIATYLWVISMNKPEVRKGKVQLIDATSFFVKLRKSLGNKRNEISAENRKDVTKLYADFTENEFCKIFPNTEFMYREYKVMQPLQRSYAITEERIEKMLADGALSGVYDESKIYAWENSDEELSAKEQAKLKAMQNSKPLFDLIVQTLRANVSDKVWKNPTAFTPILKGVFSNLSLGDKTVSLDKKLFEKIIDGLSVMDKTADIQKDKRGATLYDPETADTEIVKYGETIDDYMKREVLSHVPDAKAFFEENLNAKKSVIKTGAEIPFTRYFYKYQQPEKSEVLAQQFLDIEKSVSKRISVLFDQEEVGSNERQ